ncbi:PIG-L deacetylase family protein [Streptomyces yangpuensis]|uniref:PIG-L deacetylase family protein n=1 Tax=Streptomyces yangpuensis TaxID=1648182 RepID=UPI0037178006
MTLPDLLAVFAHPDDEALVAGGVLARHAASGARTGVVTTTWSPDSPRAAELAASLRILGAGVPRLLGHADARVPGSAPGRARLLDVPLDEVVGQVVRQVREFRPELLVTHDAYGQLTGHPDHVHTHRVALLAAHAAGLGHLYPEAGEPWQPRAVHLATHPDSGIAELGPLLTRAGKKLLSAPDEHVDAAVDVRPWLTEKWSAVLAHRSEVARERSLPGILSRLPADVRERIISTEWFTRIDLRRAPRDDGPAPAL